MTEIFAGAKAPAYTRLFFEKYVFWFFFSEKTPSVEIIQKNRDCGKDKPIAGVTQADLSVEVHESVRVIPHIPSEFDVHNVPRYQFQCGDNKCSDSHLENERHGPSIPFVQQSDDNET